MKRPTTIKLLGRMRKFARRAWLLHAWLISGMILMPMSAGQGAWIEVDVDEDGSPDFSYDDTALTSTEVDWLFEDNDFDGLINGWEVALGYDPENSDSDGDGWSDYDDYYGWIYDDTDDSTQDEDSDGDGLYDQDEYSLGSDPYNVDTDYDCITDYDEVYSTYTDPCAWDSDGDGYSDMDEYYSCYAVDYHSEGAGQSYYDWDGDGWYNYDDPWPLDSGNDDGMSEPEDYSTNDSDGDGYEDDNDSHPDDGGLWEDWDDSGYNDSEEDAMFFGSDSDWDGYEDEYDSHPDNDLLWNDFNDNGVNDDEEWFSEDDYDGDGYLNEEDSHLWDSDLWEDWDYNGINDSEESWDDTGWEDPTVTDSDGDGHDDDTDTHPEDPSLWEDHDGDGTNDSEQYSTEPDPEPDPSDWDWEDDDADGWANIEDTHPDDDSLWSDWDEDGLNEEDETAIGSNPWIDDTDNDGLLDGEEVQYHTNPNNVDSDDDGLTDSEEALGNFGSDPTDAYSLGRAIYGELYKDYFMVDLADDDEDGIPNRIEVFYEPYLDPTDELDAMGDLDGDGISNLAEYQAGTDLRGNLEIFDYDHDGLNDIVERTWSQTYAGMFSPIRFDDAVEDADGDGAFNFEELLILGSNPGVDDSIAPGSGWTDGHFAIWRHSVTSQTLPPSAQLAWEDLDEDGVPDGFTAWVSAQWGSQSFPAPAACDATDHDQDGMSNVWEYRYGLDVRSPVDAGHDEEPDGLTNLTEFRFGTHPRLKDSSANGQNDDAHFYQHGAVSVSSLSGLTSRYRAQMAADLAAGTVKNFTFQDFPGWSEGGGPSPVPECDCGDLDCDECEGFGYLPCTGFCSFGQVPCSNSDCSGGSITTLVPCLSCGGTGLDDAGVDDTGSGAGSDCGCSPGDGSGCTVCSDPNWGGGDSGGGSSACGTCNGTGEEEDIVDCGTCGGSGTEDCSTCEGLGEEECGFCIGTGLSLYCACGEYLCNCPGDGSCKDDGSDDSIPYTNQSISVSDSAGSRYRKIGLNGLPLSDSKPQVQDESGEAPEETYVDAYTWHLRHGVSDVYVQAEGSLLPLMVRRDLTPEVYSFNSGLQPWERPDSPFGPGWSSNLCAFIKFEALGADSTAFYSATVHDEQGSTQRFLSVGGNQWVSDREERSSARMSYNEFSASPTGYIEFDEIRLTKKFGTLCEYEMSDVRQSFTNDRSKGDSGVKELKYARLVRVTDRFGNQLVYDYPDTEPGEASTLIPSRIWDPDRPGHEIKIQQENGRIVRVMGPSGGVVDYSYGDEDYTDWGMEVTGGVGFPEADPTHTWDLLQSVDRSGAAVEYEYTFATEAAASVSGSTMTLSACLHVELGVITDELGRAYRFECALDQSVSSEELENNEIVVKPRYGAPMLVTSVTGPGGRVEISGSRLVASNGVQLIGSILTAETSNQQILDLTPIDARMLTRDVTADDLQTVVTLPDEGGVYSYRFTAPSVYDPFIAGQFNDQGPIADDDASNVSLTLSYQTLEITSPLGVETYEFNPQAGMALSSAADLSGNTIQFYYSAADVPSELGLTGLPSNAATNGALYDDPIVEVDALGGVKTFTYDPDTRVMTSMTDPLGTSTTYGIENRPNATPPIMGLKVSEKVHDSNGQLLRDTRYRYDHPTFKGLVTSSWTISPDESVMPSSVTVTTLGDPNDGGAGQNPGWWREVTQTSGTATPTGTLAEALIASTTISDFNGNKRSVIDGRGLITNFGYDDRNRLTSVTHPDDTTKTLDYDAHGNLISETNENDVTTFHEYDDLNRRIKTTIDLNGDGDADPNYTEITVDPETGEPSYNGDIVSSTTYNARGQVATVTDPRGKVTTNTYDGGGRLIEVDDGGFITSYAYGANSGGGVFDTSGFKPTQITDPRGVVTTLVNDALYRTTSTTVAGIGTTSTSYDAAGHPLTVTDPLNRVTTNTYDALGQLIEIEYPDNSTVETYYTHHGQPWKVVNELGIETTTDFDALGRPIATHAPAVDGEIATSYTFYDEAGNAVAAQDPLGRVVYTEYDLRNRPFRVTAPPVWDAVAGAFAYPVTETTYDALGQVVSVEDPLGAVTTTWRDAAGRAYRADDALGHSTLSTYDPAGNATKVTDPNGNSVTNTYDAHGRLTQTVDGAGIVNTFAYDEAGNRTEVRDGLNALTTFQYDALNRLTRQEFANGDTWTYTHNAVQKTSQTDPNGVTTNYTYDARDRLLTVTAPDLDRTMAYDAGGRLTSVTEAGNAQATVSYEYDDRGRVTSETSCGVTHSYSYDAAGNRISAAYGTGRTVNTTYDALNRPETIAEGGRLTRYGYDLAGRAVLLIAGNGQVSENEYDMAGRLVNRTLFRSLADRTDGGVLAEFGWSHDALGNVTAHHETWPGEPSRGGGVRTTTMTYDGANRLWSELISEPGGKQTSTTYAYDDANNRTLKTVTVGGVSDPAPEGQGAWSYTYNPANQLTSWSKFDSNGGTLVKSATLTYDANGNRTAQTVIDAVAGGSDPGSQAHSPSDLAPGATTYAWDSQNRLTGVTMPNGSEHAYSYDYRTRRIGTHEQPSALSSPPSAAKHTTITFSGGLSIAEWDSTGNSEPETTNPPTVAYTRGPDMGGGVGGLLYTTRRDAVPGVPTLRYNLSNGRGDIVAQSDPAATLTWTASYEAHGRRTTETGSNADKQRGNSKDEDPTGLLNEGFRYRDLETGVWLSRDPAGFVDGPNVYAYVKQNPWTLWDPEGLEVPKNRREANQKGRDINRSLKAFRHLTKQAKGKSHDSPEGMALMYRGQRLLEAINYMMCELAVYQQYADAQGNLDPWATLRSLPDPVQGWDPNTTAGRRFSGLPDAVSVGLRDQSLPLLETGFALSGARSLTALIEEGGAKFLGEFGRCGGISGSLGDLGSKMYLQMTQGRNWRSYYDSFLPGTARLRFSWSGRADLFRGAGSEGAAKFGQFASTQRPWSPFHSRVGNALSGVTDNAAGRLWSVGAKRGFYLEGRVAPQMSMPGGFTQVFKANGNILTRPFFGNSSPWSTMTEVGY